MNPFNHTPCLLSLTALTLATGSAAHAGLIGDEVEIWSHAQSNGVSTLFDTATVASPGHEYEAGPGNTVVYAVDFEDTTLRLDSFGSWHSPWFNSGHPPSSLDIRDLDFVGDPSMIIGAIDVSFRGVVIDDGTPDDFAEFSADNVQFGDDWVRIEYGGYAFIDGTFVDIDITFVPAPGGVALFGAGGLCMMRRRR